MPINNRIGQCFGRLRVVADAGRTARRKVIWECICDCGTTTYVPAGALGRNTNSCGCLGPDRRPLAVRFGERYEFDTNGGCWLWTGGANPGGYGQITGDSQENLLAHRAAWMIFRGEPPKGMEVCHRCDVRACVNPDHLFLGSHLDNMRDMFAKGRRRRPRAELNPRSKLTAAQIMAVRDDPRRQIDIAAQYGIGQARVSAIKRGGWLAYATTSAPSSE